MRSFEVLRKGSDQQLDYPITDVPTPATVSIAKAYYMIKAALDDEDANALVTLTITPSPGAQGVISDTGANDGRGKLTFFIADDALAALDPRITYFSSIKCVLSNGNASAPRDPDAPVRILAAGVGATS